MGSFKDLGRDLEKDAEIAKEKTREGLHKAGDKMEHAAD
jgi:hypothetical protein